MSSSTGSNRGLGTVATLGGLLVVVAAAVVITLVVERRAPAFTSFGTGVMSRPVALHREPSESTKTTGAVTAGEPVEILQYLPPKTMDSWILIRPTSNPKTYGYSLLGNLDHLKTKDEELNLWHATQRLENANSKELKERLATIGEMTKARLPSSAATDQIYQKLATESVRLANETLDNPDEARALATSAEAYLTRISADSPVAAESEGVRSAIQKIQIALGDLANPEKEVKAPVTPSPRAEMTRLMKDANAAFTSGRYAKAADLSQQAAAKGEGKRDLANLVEQAKALQKKAETAQEDFEKVNIQNR